MVHDYMASDEAFCPFCNSSEIEKGQLDIDGDSAWRTVKRATCGHEGQDVSFPGAIDVIAEHRSITTVMPEPNA